MCCCCFCFLCGGVVVSLVWVFQNYKPDTHEAIYILGRDESVSSNTLSPVK